MRPENKWVTSDKGKISPRDPITAPDSPYASTLSCGRCHKLLPLQWPELENPYQTDNELVIEFHGGYGSFTDCLDDCPADSMRLCHECAHDLCDFLDIDPSYWHTHRPDSGQHPDHHK